MKTIKVKITKVIGGYIVDKDGETYIYTDETKLLEQFSVLAPKKAKETITLTFTIETNDQATL